MTTTAAGRRTIQHTIDTGVISLRGLSPQRHRFELSTPLNVAAQPTASFRRGRRPCCAGAPTGCDLPRCLPAGTGTGPRRHQPTLVVVGHVNPNRVALLHALAETGYPLTLATSNAGAKLLNELWHQRKQQTGRKAGTTDS